MLSESGSFLQIRNPTDFQSHLLRIQIFDFPFGKPFSSFITLHHNRLMTLFPGPPGWACARRELLDFIVQGEINRGRHTDHPAGATPSGLTSAHLHHPPYFLQTGCPSCRPTNSVKALKAKSQIPLRHLVRTSFEPDIVMEFGRKPSGSC